MIPFSQRPIVGQPRLSLRPDLVKNIIGLLHNGWSQALRDPEFGPHLEERAIAGTLWREMENAKGELPIFILEATGTRSAKDPRFADGEADIGVLFLEFATSLPHLIVECKRVSTQDRPLQGKYISQGMDKFQNAHYGHTHDLDMMAGFVLDGSVAEVVGHINALLKRRGRSECQLTETSNFSYPCYLSKHIRTSDSRTITLLHMFFDFVRNVTKPL